MRIRRSAQRGFKLASLLALHGCACVVCCVTFPHFVGPVDTNSNDQPVHDPHCVVQPAISPDGSNAYAEITRPWSTFPGAIDVSVTNTTDKPMYNVTVRYPLPANIYVDPHGLARQLTLANKEVQAHFDVLLPHLEYDTALDFRYASSRSRTTPFSAGFFGQ